MSSPKERHETLAEKSDFIKLYDKDDKSLLTGVVNLNFMFPVFEKYIIRCNDEMIMDSYKPKPKRVREYNLERINKYRESIFEKNVGDKAVSLYNLKHRHPNDWIARNCLDWKLMEGKCLEYFLNDELIDKEGAGVIVFM